MPRVTISIIAPDHALDQEFLTLDLPPGLALADLKAFVEAETQLPPANQHFYLDSTLLSGDSKTLEEVGIKDGDMLAMFTRAPSTATPSGSSQRRQPPSSSSTTNNAQQQHQQQQRRQPQQSAQQPPGPGAQEIESTRLSILSNPGSMAQVRAQRPALADAIHDAARFRQVWEEMLREVEERERERHEQMQLLNEDPFNIEAQRKIEEMIRQQQVQDNLQFAYEHNPEVFGRVTMLYIPVEVNHHPVKAFVDSGAQTTIMSPSCAESCGIMRLIDKRYSGIAKGVGTAQILGRVHSAPIRIGNATMSCSFTVMEGKDVDLLLGLDMLKRFQAVIDLRRNMLIFGDGNEVGFLGEAEIPRMLEEALANEPTVEGPNGTAIGAQSGTVKPAAGDSLGQAAAALPSPSANASTSASTSATVPPPAAAAADSARSLQSQQQPQQQQQHQQAQPQQQPQQQPQRSQQSQYPPEAIAQLTSLGFARAEAIAALEACGGDVEYAAGLLFQG